MINTAHFRLLCLLIFLTSTLSACGNEIAVNDVTGRIEVLGNPYQSRYKNGAEVYARNIWDMQSYQGAIYLGAGNSSNDGPAPNAGPVPIIKFDLATQAFKQEGLVDDEQIEVYHIIEGAIYTPGHDPRENWDWGNFYQRENNGTWVKYRNIPSAIHTYSLAWYGERLFGSVNLKDDVAAVSISNDKGKTWKIVPIGRSRVYGFITVANKFYAVKRFPLNQRNKINEKEQEQYNPVYEYISSDGFVSRKDIFHETIFPKTQLNKERKIKIARPLTVGEKSVYIGAYVHNDHQQIPFGVYVASSLEEGNAQVERVQIPDGYRPWDLLLNEGYLYVLIEDKSSENPLVKVIRSPTNKLTAWSEVLQFSAPTFARSFEMVNGDFYFSLGSEITNPKQWKQEELNAETGQILRVKNVFKTL